MEERPAFNPSRETLRRVARELAQIDLGEVELEEVERALKEIARLRELDIPEVEPATVFIV
ncbi:MAG: hypothetical protein HYY20_06420 [Candidatus Tectomicrobia bacterium]|uniref:Uncharacterized protein n=1 Tax=Tectimicrobiota bacterium TaxID=2528274 RepID=A0A932CNN3_UNCTE|nr:hypothetical protein [Candidatus Tectomicrobia bacterium]